MLRRIAPALIVLTTLPAPAFAWEPAGRPALHVSTARQIQKVRRP